MSKAQSGEDDNLTEYGYPADWESWYRAIEKVVGEFGLPTFEPQEEIPSPEESVRWVAMMVQEVLSQKLAGPEPGEPIATVSCPCCSADLEVQHGDEPGEIGTIGSGGIVGRFVSERDKARENWNHVCDLLAETEKKLAQANERNADLARQLMEAAEERIGMRPAKVVEELEADNANLRRVLESLEWYDEGTEPSGRGYRHFRVCPICHGRQTDGHAPDCALAAALSSAPANPYAAVVEALCDAKWAIKAIAPTSGFSDLPELTLEKIDNALAQLTGGDARG